MLEAIALVTYGEAKEAKEDYPNLVIEDIDDDIYGFVVNNVFIPMKVEGEYLTKNGCYENWLKGEIE